MHRSIIFAVAILATSTAAGAQSLGTFRWQMQPYCNVVTLDVTQTASGFRVEGTDDQCGAGADRASAIGTAFPNPDGTIGMGFTIVLAPGGANVHVDVALTPGAFDGTWRDSGGVSGRFVLTQGAGTGGAVRPRPALSGAIQLRADGGVLATATGAASIPATGAGDRMMWHAGKASFRVGSATGAAWDDANIGINSTAGGKDTMAKGPFSVAFGLESVASGLNSSAFGYRATAGGANSFAAGDLANAGGFGSVAMGRAVAANGWGSVALGEESRAEQQNGVAIGYRATATGTHAVAMGDRAFAAGNNSMALGVNVRTNITGAGSFVLGDSSTLRDLESSTPNQFMTRFAGGYVLWSTANPVYPTSPGVQLAPGGSSWSSLSDVNSKEHFTDLDGESVLAKLAAMPVRTWNYKAQDAAIRHAGPTAQDFFAAFGLGEDERRISTIDADGIALAGVKALVARTEALAARAERLEQENHALRQRLERLEGPLVRR